MATIPFSITTTVPGNSDFMSLFPALERDYRDTVNSWLSQLSSPTTGLLLASAMPNPLLVSTDAGAAVAPNLVLHRDSASPAASDLGPAVDFAMEDTASNKDVVARIMSRWDDPTSGSEDATLLFQTIVAGALTTGMTLTGTTLSVTTLDATTLTGAGKPPTLTIATSSGTWTRPSGCKYVQLLGQGGGGAGGGVDGQGVGTAGAGGGGGSGAWGWTDIVAAPASFTYTIGAAGAFGAAGAVDGGAGGNTAATVNGIGYSWLGGAGGSGYTASTSPTGVSDVGVGGFWTNLVGASNDGLPGISNAAAGAGGVHSGAGASSLFGRGGTPVHFILSTALGGNAGQGYGSGGSGGAANNVSTNVSGASGGPGILFIYEYY